MSIKPIKVITQSLSAICLLLVMLSVPARAELVSHEFRGLELLGNLEIAEGKSLEKDGAALIVHGTVGHHGMEIISRLQQNLRNRGINSLAVTFSMGLDRREGPYECKLEHDHRHMDAVEEIASWVSWLKIAGAKRITLIGHSRGGNQAALYMTLDKITKTGGLIAPLTENIETMTMPDPGSAQTSNGGVVKIRYGGTPPKTDTVVKNLILIAPMTWTFDKARRDYPKRHKKLLGGLLKIARKMKSDGNGMMLMEGVGFLRCPKARVTADSFLDYYAPNPYYFTPNLLTFIGRPTLIIAGGGDAITPDLTAAMASLPYSRTLQLSVIGGADHFFRDLFAEDMAEKISIFMKNPPKSKS